MGFHWRAKISAVSKFQRFSSSGLAVIAKKRSKYGKMLGFSKITKKGLVPSLPVDPICSSRLTKELSELSETKIKGGCQSGSKVATFGYFWPLLATFKVQKRLKMSQN